MDRQRWYLSTVDSRAGALASEYGLGVEIAEFCTAYNMDRDFSWADQQVRQAISGVSHTVLHGPFNELFPCAIDPEARALAARRYCQALELTRRYGGTKLVLHGGFQPRMYYPCWYQDESVKFWREFLPNIPQGITVCLENVFEPEPEMLKDIVSRVDDPRLAICLDVGHVNAYSEISPLCWVEELKPWLSHFHIHNNGGTADTHDCPGQGTMPVGTILEQTQELNTTYTLELPRSKEGIRWLLEEGWI